MGARQSGLRSTFGRGGVRHSAALAPITDAAFWWSIRQEVRGTGRRFNNLAPVRESPNGLVAPMLIRYENTAPCIDTAP